MAFSDIVCVWIVIWDILYRTFLTKIDYGSDQHFNKFHDSGIVDTH